MARDLVKTVTGRKKELLVEAAIQVRIAADAMKKAQIEAVKAQAHFDDLLEMATGKPVKGFELDLETGEVWVEREKAKPRARARSRAKTNGKVKAKAKPKTAKKEA